MTDTTPTSEILYEAADLIEKRGWATGAASWPMTGADPSPLCLEGGILAALGQTSDDLGIEFATCPAYRAVQEHLGLDTTAFVDEGGDASVAAPLWEWNDAVDDYSLVYVRTADEVIATLRAAAVIEAAKEQAAVDTPAVSVAPVRSAL